jgi:hypothetical protein
MLEIEKQLMVVDTQSPEEGAVVKKQRPKIKRREVVNGKPKLGRPKKSEIEKKKKPGLIGRPPGSGDGARIAEFKARLLATAGDSVINKVIEIALTDGHPVQSAALKMCVDRVLPMSYFDKEKQGGSVPTISINISGMNNTTIDAVEHGIIDTDITDIEVSE